MTGTQQPRSAEKAQRIRLRFARGPEATAIGHLDAARCWEQALCAAGVVLSYSQGNRPAPRITLAAGLGANVTSDGELLDAVLAEFTDVSTLIERVQAYLPAGLTALDAREVGVSLPSLPTLVRWADYEVDIHADDPSSLRSRVEALLSNDTLPWVDTRGAKTREYDLRALIESVRAEPLCEGTARLLMRLRCDPSGVGRPDQVAKALGLDEPARIHRFRLVLAETSPAHDAWRRRGRYLA
jgi:radical SAM-linked protein